MLNIIHELDRLCFISGVDVVSASAEIATLATDVEVEDSASVSYRFSNGAIGSVTTSSSAPGNRSYGLQIIGTEGQITLGTVVASLLRETTKRMGRSYIRRILPSPLSMTLAFIMVAHSRSLNTSTAMGCEKPFGAANGCR